MPRDDNDDALPPVEAVDFVSGELTRPCADCEDEGAHDGALVRGAKWVAIVHALEDHYLELRGDTVSQRIPAGARMQPVTSALTQGFFMSAAIGGRLCVAP